MASGVLPQSSCNFNPQAPASTTSRIPFTPESLPLPVNPKLRGIVSVAAIMFCMYHLLDVHVVAFVPAEGPVPPPTTVVMPEASACCVRGRFWSHIAAGQGAEGVDTPLATAGCRCNAHARRAHQP